MFKIKVCTDGAKQSDPELDAEFVNAVMDKIDQVLVLIVKKFLMSKNKKFPLVKRIFRA